MTNAPSPSAAPGPSRATGPSAPPGALARHRRYVALCEGRFNAIDAKTAVGVLRYGPSEVVAVVDSQQAGERVRDAIPSLKSEAPIVASLEEALRFNPDAALVGVASPGGGLPAGWKQTLLRALESGLSLVNGLHDFLGNDPELAAAATSRGLDIWDLRRPPATLRVGRGAALGAKSLVVLTVGADCSVGKMTASLEIVRSLRELGVSAEFIPTGQTGMAIAGWGCAIDAVVADFVAGAVEEMVMSRDGQADVLIVEGQGSLIHPAFSGVTLGLLHGCMPHALVACCDPTLGELKRGYGIAIPPLADWLADYRHAMRFFRPATTLLGVALDCRQLDDAATADAYRRYSAEGGGVPAVDPVKGSGRVLAEAIAAMARGRAGREAK